ncbi:BMP family lipoprotein [Lactococcus formosensis]|uniref:BMP family lipoprotein n=1 Tax=Lactococcus formosensis TaxID=1281486 RepID=UPI0024355E9D|nr:BMP family protein [Lactococcus formosensis]MDG6120752.1 BMP family protein [Lactococcus formosensis]
MNKRILTLGALALASVTILAGCRGRNTESASAATDLKVALVPSTGGVDDRSFNQSAWEGLQEWGKENGLSQSKGINYFNASAVSEYTTNFNSAVSAGYGLVFGVGFDLQEATSQAAKNNPDTKFTIIDSVIKGQDNVASATFADQEAAYLAGVAAAKTTKTDKVGFVGGMQSDIITAFEKGFTAGVKSVNPDIKIEVQYAGTFTDAAKGKTIAAAMYGSGNDVIYQAAGGSGAGVFSEAKALNATKNEGDKVWVIGVDQDQEYLGNYKSKDGKDSNFVLASSVKEVGVAVKDIANKTKDDKFPGGQVLNYNLKNGGVSLSKDNLSDKTWKEVEAAKQNIIDGKVTVPEK